MPLGALGRAVSNELVGCQPPVRTGEGLDLGMRRRWENRPLPIASGFCLDKGRGFLLEDECSLCAVGMIGMDL